MFKLDLQQIGRLITYGEKKFPYKEARQSIRDHTAVAAGITVSYFVLVFSVKRFMKYREPFKLDRPLQFWNLLISIFSILTTYKMWDYSMEKVRKDGLLGFQCHSLTVMPEKQEYWFYLLLLSKAVEFIDTFFIVLRKKPLIFLHWYHHMATFMFFVVHYPLQSSQFRAGSIMNVAVHAVMYPYYLIRSLHIPLPGIIAKLVTSLQLVQFVIFVTGSIYHYYFYYFTDVYHCDSAMFEVHQATVLNGSYFLLFANFFLQSYVLRGGKTKYKSQ